MPYRELIEEGHGWLLPCLLNKGLVVLQGSLFLVQLMMAAVLELKVLVNTSIRPLFCRLSAQCITGLSCIGDLLARYQWRASEGRVCGIMRWTNRMQPSVPELPERVIVVVARSTAV